MKITRSLVDVQLRILESDIAMYKKEKTKTHSKAGLLDFSILILSNIQLVSPNMNINANDPQFQKLYLLQKQIRQLQK